MRQTHNDARDAMTAALKELDESKQMLGEAESTDPERDTVRDAGGVVQAGVFYERRVAAVEKNTVSMRTDDVRRVDRQRRVRAQMSDAEVREIMGQESQRTRTFEQEVCCD